MLCFIQQRAIPTDPAYEIRWHKGTHAIKDMILSFYMSVNLKNYIPHAKKAYCIIISFSCSLSASKNPKKISDVQTYANHLPYIISSSINNNYYVGLDELNFCFVCYINYIK